MKPLGVHDLDETQDHERLTAQLAVRLRPSTLRQLIELAKRGHVAPSSLARRYVALGIAQDCESSPDQPDQ